MEELNRSADSEYVRQLPFEYTWGHDLRYLLERQAGEGSGIVVILMMFHVLPGVPSSPSGPGSNPTTRLVAVMFVVYRLEKRS